MLNGKVVLNTASKELNSRLRRINDKLKFFKTWGTVVLNKAKSNARAKGGRRLWKRIADATHLTSVSGTGAVIECFDYIGAHKETGGPIRAKNKKALTIPIHEMARGKTARELELDGLDLFRPKGKDVLGISLDGMFVALFALRKSTRSQRPDQWWPDGDWALQKGLEEAEWHIGKGN